MADIKYEITKSLGVLSESPNAVYGSTVKPQVYLFVYTINVPILGNLNQKLSQTTRYAVTNFNMTGGKLYVLFDSTRKHVFHIHYSKSIDETHLFRTYESLDLQFYPYPKYDAIYTKVYVAPPGAKGNGRFYEPNQLK